MILMLGGHYSYAKVPVGFWMEDWFEWARNNYDKIGHFMQGFGPAICAREIISRTSPLKRGKWLGFISIAVPLAFSALYEIIEWAASLSNPADTEAFLGTQGYVWDTQTDMFLCLIGSLLHSFCSRDCTTSISWESVVEALWEEVIISENFGRHSQLPGCIWKGMCCWKKKGVYRVLQIK